MSNVDGVVFVLKLVITLIKIQFYLPPNPPMTYKEKVKRIYEAMADKTLSFGCNFMLPPQTSYPEVKTLIDIEKIPEDNIDEYGNKYILYYGRMTMVYAKSLDNIEIIGHPIHIGVVLDWIEKSHKESLSYTFKKTIRKRLLSLRKDKHQPLPLNPTKEWYEVIDFIIGLLD